MSAVLEQLPVELTNSIPAPSTRRPVRYSSLDLWRGVACLMVIIYHSTMVYSGHLQSEEKSSKPISTIGTWCLAATQQLNAGVPMFFVISGFCIAASADKLRQSNHSVLSYFLRRFRRIYPPLWIVIILSILFFLITEYWLTPKLLSEPPFPQYRLGWYTGWNWLGNITLTETWRHYLVGSPRANFPEQAWTLCYEEQFYAVVGFLLLISTRKIFAAAAVLSLSCVVAMIMCQYLAIPTTGLFIDGSWLTFAAGFLVYYRVQYVRGFGVWVIYVILAIAVSCSFWMPDAVPGGRVAFVFALVIMVLHRWDSLLSSASVFKPLMLCGSMCYSLYLVHQIPVKAASAWLYHSGAQDVWSTLLLTVPVCLGISILTGALYYQSVEKRFLNSPS